MRAHHRMRRVVAVTLLGLAPLGFTAEAGAADVPTHVIAANVNDAGIDPNRGSNHVWLAADPARRVGKLLVFMSGGGPEKPPQDWGGGGGGGGGPRPPPHFLPHPHQGPHPTPP